MTRLAPLALALAACHATVGGDGVDASGPIVDADPAAPDSQIDAGTGDDRTVAAEADVPSPKRGVAAQGNDYPANLSLTQADLDVLAPGLTWFYNWGPSTNLADAHGHLEFVPMAWGHANDNAAVASWLAAHPATSVVFSANEPNRGDQANLSPTDCAAFIEATRAIAGGRPVIGPHLAASATVTDYRNQVGAAITGGLSAGAIHIYETNSGGFDYWASTWPYAGWPTGTAPPATVWIKELNIGDDNASESAVIAYMIHAVDLMERDPRVARYAWWKDRRAFDAGHTKPPSHFLLSNTANGALTALGDLYVHMPVHDPHLYYAVPGRLEAERYVAISDPIVALQRTADATAPGALNGDGRLDVAVPTGGWLDYQLDAGTGGAYTVELRSAGDATLAIGGAAITTSGNGYATRAAMVALTPGRQTLRLAVTSGIARVNWLRFTPVAK
ncbi:MAG: hypothetical protein K8W52_31310 [Deltaproteobacteria bacterium]|nr:hypothetical protein [Deltaproteobacteria bacterium]